MKGEHAHPYVAVPASGVRVLDLPSAATFSPASLAPRAAFCLQPSPNTQYLGSKLTQDRYVHTHTEAVKIKSSRAWDGSIWHIGTSNGRREESSRSLCRERAPLNTQKSGQNACCTASALAIRMAALPAGSAGPVYFARRPCRRLSTEMHTQLNHESVSPLMGQYVRSPLVQQGKRCHLATLPVANAVRVHEVTRKYERRTPGTTERNG